MGNILTSWFQWKKPNSPDERQNHGKKRDNDDPFPPSRSLASPQKSEEEPKPEKIESAPPPIQETVTEIQSLKEESIPEASQSVNEAEDKHPLEIKLQRPPSPVHSEGQQQRETSPELSLDKQEELDFEEDGSRNERDPEIVDNAVVKIQAGIRGYLTRKALKENPPVTRPSNSPRRATEAAGDDEEVEETNVTERDSEKILVISEPQKPEQRVVVPQEAPIKTEIISRVSTEIPEVVNERASDLAAAGSQGPIVLPVSKIEKELVDLLADAAAAGTAESTPKQAPPRPAPPAPSQATTDHAHVATPVLVAADVEKKETPRVPVVQNEEEYDEEYTDEEYEEEEEEEEVPATQPPSVNHVGGQETPVVTPNRTVEGVTRDVRPEWVTSSVYDTVQGNQDEEEEYEEEEEEEEEESGTIQPTTPQARVATPPARVVTPPARVVTPQFPQESQQAPAETRPAPSPIKDAKE